MPHPVSCINPALLTTPLDLIGSLPEHLDGQSFAEFERDAHEKMREVADLAIEHLLRHMLAQKEWEQELIEDRRAASDKPLLCKGTVDAPLVLLGGKRITLPVRVLRPARSKRGRPKGQGKRGQSKGYENMPALQALGCFQGLSAALWQECTREAAQAESFEVAYQSLARRGLPISYGRFHTVVTRAGQLLLRTRDALLEAEDGSWLPCVAGLRVMIMFDGGRIQKRVDHKGRKKDNGYRDFDAKWVEPRLFVIYTIDEAGKFTRTQARVADAMLGEGHEVMALLKSYLKAMKISDAAQVVVAADGQHWQWEHINQMLDELGVEQGKRREVLDFCHAVGHAAKIADTLGLACKTQGRGSFIKTCKNLLQDGRIDALIAHCEKLGKRCGEKIEEKVKEQVQYFEKHKKRMNYKSLRAACVPCGSGMVESMIRQVVNMRLKSSGKFWKVEGAQGMLMMRAMLKTRRLEVLMGCAMKREAAWRHASQVVDSDCVFQEAA